MNKAITSFLGNRKGATKKPKNELRASHSKIQRINPKKKPSTETLVENRPGPREREREAEQQSTAASQSVRQKPIKPRKTKKEEDVRPKPAQSLKPGGTPPTHTPPIVHTPKEDEDAKLPLAIAPSYQSLAVKKGVSREAPSTRTNIHTIHPVVTTSTSTVSCTASSSATSHDTTWIGASAAKAWMEKADFTKVKTEFDKISSMAVDVEKECKKWKSNAKLNQSDEYPVLDSKLVKTEEYVNISHVDVPLHRNILIGQTPLPGSEEVFWKAVFDMRAMRIHLMIGDDEKIEFFPLRSGDFMHYGSMFVNNRKVENISDDIARFAVEVLPAGCSNSIITSLTVIKNWNMDSVHAKYACVLKESIDLNNFLSNSQPDETALVMSKNGAGRPGYFVALTIAATKMDQKIEPDVLEIVKSIRSQRPRAVDSLPQYASLYISLFYFIKRKMSKTGEGDKKAVADTNDPLCRKAIQLTNQFMAGLLEAAAAQSTKSTMTKKSKVKSKTKVLHNVKGERKSRADRGAIVKEPQQQSTAGTSIRVQRSNRRKAKTPIVTTPVSMTPTGTTPTGNSEDGPTKLMPAPSKETMSRKAFSREPPSTRTSKVPAAKVENVWLGASAAKAWMEKADFTKAKSEFEKISSMVVDVEKECKKWKANAKLNQSDEYPVLDSKLVKTEEYVNMSHVDVPLHRNILMGQIPLPGSEEAFWKAVFDQRAMCIHLMIGDDEKIEFFPQRTGDFMHYGSMFVNNRKVENISDDIARFAVEVLPAGCSNSIITSFTVIKNWNMDTVHAKYACVIKQTIEMNNFLSNAQPDETALVMSKHGAGRAGYFVALTIAVAKMDQKVEPDLLDIVKSMRAQRPRTVDTLPQYASLYISMFYFIKRKMSKAVEGDKKATPDTNDPLCKKAMQLTTQFVNGLVEEANAAGARSTMTSIP